MPFTTKLMENKNIIQYAILLAMNLLCIIGIANLFKGSDNLKETKQTIDKVLIEVSETKKIIKEQKATINDLQKLNKDLLVKVNAVDSLNQKTKKDLDVNFFNANKTINNLIKTIDGIKIPIIH